jgi:hypothetical protein
MTPWQPNRLAIEDELCQKCESGELDASASAGLIDKVVDIVDLAILEMME